MSDSETMAFSTDGDTRAAILEYQAERGHQSRSEAIRELVEAGARQQRNPLLNKFWSRSYGLTIEILSAAAIIAAVGAAPGVPVGVTMTIGMALALLGVCLLAIVELTRAFCGVNEIGKWLVESKAAYLG